MGKRKLDEEVEEPDLESPSTSRRHHKKHKHKSKKHKKRRHEGKQSDPSNSESIELEDDSQNIFFSYENEDEQQSFIIEEQLELGDLGMLEDIGEHMVIESYDLPLEDLEVDVESQEIELDMVNVHDHDEISTALDDAEGEEEEIDVDVEDSVPKRASEETKKSRKSRDKEDSDDERWLDALESGKVEEVDEEMKRIKDPKLMTARQRALLERKGDVGRGAGDMDDPLVSLPTGYKEVQVTEELIKKRALKSQLRRQQAEEKREKDKKRTMDRLLLKKEAKTRLSKHVKKVEVTSTAINGSTTVYVETPQLSLIYTLDSCALRLPPNVEFPLTASVPVAPPPSKLCGVTGCKNPRKYSSKSGTSLCSLGCYKQLQNIVSVN